MATKILFTDLDGTLLNDSKEISPGNQAAINEALAQGHKIVVSTGRPIASARIQIARLGLNQEGCYAITYNGGLIYDTCHQEILYSHPIPLEYVKPVFQAALSRNMHIHTYTDTHVLACRDTAVLRAYTATTLMTYEIDDDDLSHLVQPPYKMLAIAEQDRLLKFQQEVLPAYAGKLHSFFSMENLLEIVPAGVDKGSGVRWLCSYLGIPIEHSVAAGDAENDISMLEAAHVGAVMCNADPGIADHGTYVTKNDNNHDGVAEIIRTFILN
jgi:Cof subfamily protein (haloacid dehalogenase superfamily)